jgi:hypothetical protein
MDVTVGLSQEQLGFKFLEGKLALPFHNSKYYN